MGGLYRVLAYFPFTGVGNYCYKKREVLVPVFHTILPILMSRHRFPWTLDCVPTYRQR